jgi:hypothetical protein
MEDRLAMCDVRGTVLLIVNLRAHWNRFMGEMTDAEIYDGEVQGCALVEVRLRRAHLVLSPRVPI